VVFSCNWDGWSCIESAANSGFHYPPSVRVVRVSCLSRIHAGLILKAFGFGADGVMLLGCQPGSCHFGTDEVCISNEYEKTRRILQMLGIGETRLTLARLPAFDSGQFKTKITDFMAEIERLPSVKSAKIARARVA